MTLAVLGVMLSACNSITRIARVNHFHSDANQKKAEKAVEAFQQATSDRVGLGPTLARNLEAVTALRRTVADTRAQLDDRDRAIALADITWLDLRRDFLDRLGAIEAPATPAGNAADAVVAQRRRVLEGGRSLSERIRHRVERIEAVVTVLEALIAGDRALVVQAKQDVERAAQKTQEPKKDGTQGDQGPSFVKLLVDFQRAVSDAGRLAAREDETRAAASALEKALRERAETSRAPAAAYALVAMVGTGLGENDFRGLDAFLKHLGARLDGFFDEADRVRASVTQGGPLRADWQAFLAAADKARRLTALAYARSLISEGMLLKAGDRRQAQLAQEQALRRALGAAPTISATGDLDDASNQTRLSATRAAITGSDAPTDARQLIDRLLKRTESVSAEIDALRETLDRLPISLESIAALLTPPSGGATDASRAALGADFLRKILASNPKLVGRLDEAIGGSGGTRINQEDLARLGTLVEDVGRERDAAAQRVADYLKTLRRIQLDLHEENLRHDQATVAIAAQEIKRWKLILLVDRDVSRIYGPPAPCDERTPPARPGQLLFNTDAHVTCWAAWYGAWHRGVKRTPPAGAEHPVIRDEDPVLPSVRRLAATGRLWQNASASAVDPRGFDTEMSNQRLARAAQVINGHLLMLSLNDRLAADNRIRLSTEIAEHDLHLNGISARATEAGLTLALGDVGAFHASGITQADLQAFFGVIQSALLSYIGGGI